MRPAMSKWWDDVVSSYTAPVYASAENARLARESETGGRFSVSKGKGAGSLIWGDRVRIVGGDATADDIVRIEARGREAFIRSRHLGGAPLLEVYVIDVGQGDGLLIVTPEGHNLMIDGGNLRKVQNGGKNAADFVDWKFSKDYCRRADRADPDKRIVKLDAMIATHNDQDHFGGLLDLLDIETSENRSELDCSQVRVDAIYHAGLSWWWKKGSGDKKNDRTLAAREGYFKKLIGDRASCARAVAKLDAPDADTLSGSWGRFIRAATQTRRASGEDAPALIERLSSTTHDWLPGFDDQRRHSAVAIRVLGPVAEGTPDAPKLKVFPDGDSKNTNGHSALLRLDYGDRRILLTGDLNTHAQRYLMERYGDDFEKEFGCDVAKGCHHGSNDVSYKFLLGMQTVATVISSGDAETHDHPRPAIVAASAVAGRKLLSEDGEELICPLVFMTEVARSYGIGPIASLEEFGEAQPAYSARRPKEPLKQHKTLAEKSRFRALLASAPKKPREWPRLDKVMAVKDLVYGLVNVRTDGETLFFASYEEAGASWATHVLTGEDIAQAELGM